MHKKITLIITFLLITVAVPTVFAGDLDAFLRSVNISAQGDIGGFKAEVSAQFGVPVAQVDAVIASVETPADAYMVFRVGQVAAQPVPVVLREYEANRGKGWGAIAKSLGIKPGSREFHALKEGFGGQEGKGKGKGKKKH